MEKENQVSKLINGRIQSAYYDVKYRPGEETKNFNLNVICSSLITLMAWADALRIKDSINNLQKKFLEALSECKTEEETKNLATFLEKLAKVGGYAETFYSNNISQVTNKETEHANQKLKEMKTEKEKPVSTVVDGKMQSKYFDIKYKAWNTLDGKNINLESLLPYLAAADITRNKEQINALMANFFKILIKCQTKEDFDKLNTFVIITANTGGYAIEFKNKIKGFINEKGKNAFLQYIEEEKRKKKIANDDDEESKEKKEIESEALKEFKKNYAKLNAELEKVKNNNMKDEDEIADLIRKYNRLQSDLYNFNGVVDKLYIAQCDEQIENSINYLRDLYTCIDEINNVFKGL